MLVTIVLNLFNEHDYHHRKGCFKKTAECNFHYPREIKDDHVIRIDFKQEHSVWYTSIGNGENLMWYPFSIEPRRSLVDVF
jgi:hypothetical protein